MANRFAAKVLEIAAFALETVDQAKSTIGGLRMDGLNEFLECIFGNDAEEFADRFVLDIVAAIGARLFEKRKGIAHAAFSHAGDDAEGAIIDLEIFFFGDEFQAVGDFEESERAEMKMLRARTNGVFQIFGLGGSHDEDDAVGRLLESLEESVGRFASEHVRFVEDDDFVACSSGGIANHLAEFADLIDAAVGGGVDLDDVERSAGSNFLAGVADAAGFGCRAVNAIEGFGEDAGGGGFADTARAGKDVGVSDTIILDGVLERFCDVSLSDEVRESLRTPLAGDDLVCHVCNAFSARAREKSKALLLHEHLILTPKLMLGYARQR